MRPKAEVGVCPNMEEWLRAVMAFSPSKQGSNMTLNSANMVDNNVKSI